MKHTRLKHRPRSLHIQFFAGGEPSSAAKTIEREENATLEETSGEASALEKGSGTEAEKRCLESSAEGEMILSLTVSQESKAEGESSHAKAYPVGAMGPISLIILLVITLLCTVAVIVYGVTLSGAFSGSGVPLGEKVLSEVFGSGITVLGGSYARVPLKRLPSQTVEDGDSPGAAEFESEPDDEEAKGDSDTQTNFSVMSIDLSVKKDNIFELINETPYSPDVEALYGAPLVTPTAKEVKEKYGSSAPVVLILHTHGTESYLPDGATVYDKNESFRSYNMEKNVLSVGRKMAEVLEAEGIGVIHLSEMFDAEDYNEAYYLAAKETSRVLEEYPSISYVFDVHRDAMNARDGAALKPLSQTSFGEIYPAQLMLVVGTDHAGAAHAEWEDNLSLALKLQASALEIDGGIMRGINLRSASFNAQLSKGAMIVEVGAAANSLREATAAAEIFAKAVAKVIGG